MGASVLTDGQDASVVKAGSSVLNYTIVPQTSDSAAGQSCEETSSLTETKHC